MRVVIDTNVLIATINRNNFEFFIYEAFIQEQFEWVVSTEILVEYEAILTKMYSEKTAKYVLNILETSPAVMMAEPYFKWAIISDDPDDNKFSDLALNVNAYCLVSKDKHFKIFKKLDFPKLNVVKPEEFKRILSGLYE
jgi:uncharacterized protein